MQPKSCDPSFPLTGLSLSLSLIQLHQLHVHSNNQSATADACHLVYGTQNMASSNRDALVVNFAVDVTERLATVARGVGSDDKLFGPALAAALWLVNQHLKEQKQSDSVLGTQARLLKLLSNLERICKVWNTAGRHDLRLIVRILSRRQAQTRPEQRVVSISPIDTLGCIYFAKTTARTLLTAYASWPHAAALKGERSNKTYCGSLRPSSNPSLLQTKRQIPRQRLKSG